MNGDSGELRRQWLDQGTPGGVAIVAMQDGPVELAVDVADARVYWTDYGGSDFGGGVTAPTPTGSTSTRWHRVRRASRPPAGAHLPLLGQRRQRHGDAGAPTGKVIAAFASDRRTPNDVLVDGDWLYLAEGGSAPYYQDGRIVALKLDGTGSQVLADGQRYPRSLAVDANAVYWVDTGTLDSDQYDGAVMRVAKP